MAALPLIVFDVNETLLDLETMEPTFERIFGDPTGEPTYVNQRALDYSGMRFEEFKHDGWEAFIHPANFLGTMKAFGHAIETGTSYETVTSPAAHALI